jgi:hypothetical protein
VLPGGEAAQNIPQTPLSRIHVNLEDKMPSQVEQFPIIREDTLNILSPTFRNHSNRTIIFSKGNGVLEIYCSPKARKIIQKRTNEPMYANLSSLPRRMKATFQGWSMVALISFIALVALGVAIYHDYGLSWDEPSQVAIGSVNYLYITNQSQSLLSFVDRYYGPAYEIIIYSLTNTSNLDQMYYARHLFTFLTFAAGLFVFYFLIRRIWKKDWLALAGCLALVLSPRIFADAFYNSKDIPFMVGFILAGYTLVRYLDHLSWVNLFLHTLSSALLIAIRIPGITIVVLTIGFVIFNLLLHRSGSSHTIKKELGQVFVYLIAGFGLVILFWPVLWHDPISEFVNAFRQMSSYPFFRSSLFKGYLITTSPPPVTYLPTWIIITTPILFLVGFIAGLVRTAQILFLTPGPLNGTEKRNLLFILTWFFFPVLAVILLKSTLYDAWRQMFFIYPAFILIGLQGLSGLISLVGRMPRPIIGQAVLAGLIVVGLAEPASFMIRSHPYQNVFFNRLAAASLSQARYLYDMDYWGLSSKAALDFILRSDPDPNILITSDTPTASFNLFLLPEAQRKRLTFTDDIQQARYFIASYRAHPQDYPYSNEVFNVGVDGAKLASVFKLH